jgi:hypothetical protein
MRKWSAIAWFIAPVLLSGIAFRGVVGVAFHFDDYLHLYDIVNLGPGLFCLVNHGGHLQLTRNAVYVLLHAAFGANSAAMMAVVLGTHLLNVALVVSVVGRLTRSLALASLAAAWWGTSAMNSEALGWFSVYGEVLSVTAILWVLRRILDVARGAPVTRATAAELIAVLLVAATTFGTGLAMVLCMPLVAYLLVPAAARAAVVPATVAAAAASVVLYAVIDRVNVALFDASSATAVVMPLRDHIAGAVQFVTLLTLNGISTALAGPFFLPLHGLGRWVPPLLGAVAVVLLALARISWRRMLACLLLSLTAYGMIGLGRYISGEATAMSSTLWGRYHYAAPLGFAFALAIAVATLLDRTRAAAQARMLLVAAGYAAAVVGLVRFFPPLPTYKNVQRDVDAQLARIDAAVRASPSDTVYLRYAPYFTSDLPSLNVGKDTFQLPRRFPGLAALFAVYHRDNVVAGRRVVFVLDDPVKLGLWQRGRRGASLLISPQEMRARGGRLQD